MDTDAGPPPPLHAPLDEYARQYQDLARDAERLTDGLSDPQLSWSPAPGRWSIGDCLAHLNAVAGPYADALEESVARAREEGLATGAPVRYGWLERWMIRSMEPPPRRRLPAPGIFRPQTPEHSAEVTAEYSALKDRYVLAHVSSSEARRVTYVAHDRLHLPHAKPSVP